MPFGAEFGNSMFFGAAERPGFFSGSIAPNYSPFGAEVFGDNPMAGMLMQMGMSWFMGNQGFTPGQFLPSQNVYDQIRARQYQMARLQAMQQAGDSDRASLVQSMRGVAQMAGVSFGLDQLKAANNIAGGVMGVMPYIAASAPMTFDAMFGSEGSQTIAAQFLFDRGQHQVDPATGLMGMSPASVGRRVDQMFQDIYRTGGPGRGLAEMRGMGIGAAASMAVEMGRRGMLGGSISAESPAEQNRQLGSMLEEMGRPNMAMSEARQLFDTRQVTASVKQMAGAVSAIKDLFGEHGRSDAPMQQLFEALTNLTSGGLAAQRPQQLETQVRQTQSLLRMGGVTLDAYGSLLARGNAVAQQAGVDPSTASLFSMDALADSIAYGNVRGMGDPGFGRMNREEFLARRQQLRAAAMGSGAANDLGALVRYQEATGNLRGEAAELVGKLQRGESVAYMPPLKVHSLLQEAAGADASLYLQATEANQATVVRYRIDRAVAAQQGREVQEQIGGLAFARALGAHGVTGARRDAVAAAMAETLFGMDQSTLADDGKRRAALVGALKGQLGDRDDLGAIAESAYGQFGVLTQQQLGMTGQKTLQAFSRQNMADSSRRTQEIADEARMAQALSPLNRAGPMARLADLIKHPAGSFMEGLAQLLGGISTQELTLAAATAGQGAGDAAANVGGRDARTRLALVTQGISATQAEYDAARARNAPRAVLQELAAQAETLASGGALAGGQYDALYEQARQRSGLSRADFEEVLKKGDPAKLPEGMRQRLLGLGAVARGSGQVGAVGLSQKVGMAVDVKAYGQQLGDNATAWAEYDRLRKKSGGADADSMEARRLSSKMASNVVARSRKLAGAILGDDSDKTLEAFGDGALDRAKTIEDTSREIESLAARAGMSVEELMASTEQGGVVGWARIQIEGRMRKIGLHSEMLAAGYEKQGRDKKALTQEQKDAAAKYRKENLLEPEKRREKMLADVERVTGARLSADDRKALVSRLGEVKDVDSFEGQLSLALKTYSEAEADVSAGRRLAPDDARRKVMGAIWNVGDTAGGRHAGRDSGTTRASLEELIKQQKEREKPQAQTLTIKLDPSSTVRLEGNQLSMNNVKGTSASAPVGVA